MSVQEIQKSERRRESPSGFHYYNLYRSNPAAWYHKYILGLRPAKTKPPLLFGGAMHDTLEVYYTNGCNIEMAIDRFRRFMADRSNDYEDPAKYMEDFNRGPKMLQVFHDKVGKDDKEKYEIIECEKPYLVPIGPPTSPMLFSVRPDRVFRDKTTGVVTPMESKTTGWSLDGMFKNTERGGQVTSYIWALKKSHPEWNVEGCMIDVIYNRGNVYDARRPGKAFRNPYQLMLWEMGMYGTIVELTQKVLTLETTPWPLLFPIHEDQQFEDDYAMLYNTQLQPEEVPPGFVKDEWKAEMSEVMKVTQSFTLTSSLKS